MQVIVEVCNPVCSIIFENMDIRNTTLHAITAMPATLHNMQCPYEMTKDITVKEKQLTFKMQRIDSVMSNKLKVLMSNPLLNVSLSTSEKVIDNSDFMTH